MSKSFYSLLLAVVVIAGAVGSVQAQGLREMRAEVEASLLVTGHVDIEPDGRVSSYALNAPEKVPPYVDEMVGGMVRSLRFDLILEQGEPVAARAKMNVRLIARASADGETRVHIQSVHFGDDYVLGDPRFVRALRLTPPSFPRDVAWAGGTGVVYLIVKIGRDGRVEDAAVEQVNLTAVGNARQMAEFRDGLSRSATAVTRRWRFAPPVEGEQASRDYWVARVPVAYMMPGTPEARDDEWTAYHPGPRQPRPDWAPEAPEGSSPDALAVGELVPETSRFRLLTPIEG